jgi:AbrB family looped-hinge helix DNA binding protein
VARDSCPVESDGVGTDIEEATFMAWPYNWHFTIGSEMLDPMEKTTVQMDRAGRVVLPKWLRDRFRLRGGDGLVVEVRGDAIELRPARAIGQLRRVNGVLVFIGSGLLESGEDLVAQSRDERIESLGAT